MTVFVWHLDESNDPFIFFKNYWFYKLLDSLSLLDSRILFCMKIPRVPRKMNNYYVVRLEAWML